MKTLKTALFTFFAFPFIAFAQDAQGVLDTVQNLLNALIPILITLAVVYFFWGLAQYILHAGSSDGKDEGKSKMIWGIVALFIMLSIWGIIGLIGETLGITPGKDLSDIPMINN